MVLIYHLYGGNYVDTEDDPVDLSLEVDVVRDEFQVVALVKT